MTMKNFQLVGDKETKNTLEQKAEVGQRPYFFWDYDIDDKEIHHILRHGTPDEKAWIITRILEYAKWDDIWRYLSPGDIRQCFHRLRFRQPQDRELWAFALERWQHDE